MAWLPEIELDGLNGFLLIFAVLALLWAFAYTSAALVTLAVWAAIVVAALFAFKYLVIRTDKLLRGGY